MTTLGHWAAMMPLHENKETSVPPAPISISAEEREALWDSSNARVKEILGEERFKLAQADWIRDMQEHFGGTPCTCSCGCTRKAFEPDSGWCRSCRYYGCE